MDISRVNDATSLFLGTGMRVMNAFMLGDTEEEHVEHLLGLMDPPLGARVIDAGCGVGEVASLMSDLRPDLRFTLVNMSDEQLKHCPGYMHQLCCSYDSIPMLDSSADVVMFNYSLCHSDNWEVTLKEANRLLREGGILFVYDMARTAGDNTVMAQQLQAVAYPQEDVEDVVQRAGFVVRQAYFPIAEGNRLADLLGGDAQFTQVCGGVTPAVWRCVKETVPGEIASAFARHTRIGFQFSGGRDSTAALYLLRPYWDRMTVYHLDTGDQFPETKDVVARVEEDMGRLVTRIVSSVEAVRRDHGVASDLVPVDNTDVGRLVSGRKVKIISRYDCCFQSLMKPMQDRMQADRVTLLVRGQRDDEYKTQPLRSGDVAAGFEVLYPIQNWSGAAVSAYLKANEFPIAPFYERGARRAPECMGCTAWWDEGRAEYLEKYHPVKFIEYRANMAVIRREINRQYEMLDSK